MATLAIGNCEEPAAPARLSFGALTRRLSALRAWYLHRQTLRRLEGVEPRLLRDMGVDPEEVYGAFPRVGLVYPIVLGGIPATRDPRRQ